MDNNEIIIISSDSDSDNEDPQEVVEDVQAPDITDVNVGTIRKGKMFSSHSLANIGGHSIFEKGSSSGKSSNDRITVHRLKDLIDVLEYECEKHKANLDLIKEALDFIIASENEKSFGK
ncbi:hypothetical protein RHGRI_006106 [Rhododendron griersonianum]|uniref:Uncharacterized protein n=1 Tax=Rhododendron griersonianum TaxID=479676 RepID=A0AAV6HW25_9ERIC|nr:hypothetical protein RHGRI_033034 [Rhododendron griersonianum]KAG5563558.1 hypothetical protein RHGRI_006106 [Rhododendron griersonianum]